MTVLPDDPLRHSDGTAGSTLVLTRDLLAPADARHWLTSAFGDRLTRDQIQDACLDSTP